MKLFHLAKLHLSGFFFFFFLFCFSLHHGVLTYISENIVKLCSPTMMYSQSMVWFPEQNCFMKRNKPVLPQKDFYTNYFYSQSCCIWYLYCSKMPAWARTMLYWKLKNDKYRYVDFLSSHIIMHRPLLSFALQGWGFGLCWFFRLVWCIRALGAPLHRHP